MKEYNENYGDEYEEKDYSCPRCGAVSYWDIDDQYCDICDSDDEEEEDE